MPRICGSLIACRDDLLWSLSDLRTDRPRLFGVFAALGAVLLGLLIAAPLLALNPDGGANDRPLTSQSDRASAQIASERYVSDSELPRLDAADEVQSGLASGETSEPQTVARLSDVLREEINEADLIHGSDGSEGGILPLDNGVVPSSGPRFGTSWEIILPAAGIRASVVQVGLTPDGAMGAPDNPFVFGWFNRSAVPGEPGNALLGGHRDYEDIDGRIDVGVGWELDEPRVGEQLIMRNAATNRYFVYEIVETATISPDSPEAIRYLSQTRESVVTLITCAGDFDEATHNYAERIIIVALLSAVAEPDI